MWQMLQRLWAVTNPASATYDSMSGPMLSGDVLVAWDHQARLAAALGDTRDFVAVPAPAGPNGQGYMTVEVELAIPKGAPNPAGARALIEWLTRPTQQAVAAANLGFFPVVQGVQLAGPQAPSLAVDSAYRNNRAAIEAQSPAGLGPDTDAFTAVYQDAFDRIVLHGEDIGTVLGADGARLQQLVDGAGARCWRPDPPSRGSCHVR
jgi:multiple sugar transport system substrate-binding protein